MNVWCSELQRTHQTAAGISATERHIRPELNELSSGDFDDLTYDEFESAHPKEFQDRIKNKLTFRHAVHHCEAMKNFAVHSTT